MRIMDAKPETFVAQLRCDRCGVEAQYNVDDGFNNFVQIGFDAAWGSDLGDGTLTPRIRRALARRSRQEHAHDPKDR